MMNQESGATKIYWTNDYSKFHFLHGNRDLNPTKLKKLNRDVENGMDLFKFCPILVNSDFHIIDGQHRFYVCKQNKLNIYYCIVPNFSLAQIAKLNNNQDRWKTVDFLNCYIDAGKNSEQYRILSDFCKEHSITITLGISLLHAGVASGGGRLNEIFREGDFTATYLKEATSLLKKATQYSYFTDIYNTRNFLTALQHLLSNKKYSHTEMLAKLNTHNLRIEKCNNSKAYLAHMEELFNFKNSKRKTIY